MRGVMIMANGFFGRVAHYFSTEHTLSAFPLLNYSKAYPENRTKLARLLLQLRHDLKQCRANPKWVGSHLPFSDYNLIFGFFTKHYPRHWVEYTPASYESLRTVYGRFEPTTDEFLLKQNLPIEKLNTSTKYKDFVLYNDADCTTKISITRWFYTKIRKNRKYINHNCCSYNLVWLPDLDYQAV